MELLKQYELNTDVCIYFNGKCIKGDGTVITDVRGSDKFEDATDDTVAMTFEGGFYDVINYNLQSLSDVVIPKFSSVLESYGLFYEQCDRWNLSAYYISPKAADTAKEEKEGETAKNPIRINKRNSPAALEPARSRWEKLQNEHGDEGSCAVGAGFTFKFNGLYYKMPPQGKWQGSLSWEASADIIRQMLIDAGCGNVIFDDGCMD